MDLVASQYVSAPTISGTCAPSRNLLRYLRKITHDMLTFALVLTFAGTMVGYAEEHIQAWIPDVLEFPKDAEIVMDRSLGSSIRLFSFSTEADVDTLLTQWEELLDENGYRITQESDQLVNRSIDFSGPGISNAKIIVAPGSNGDRRLIEFDATLE
ncbi:hypothetical protein GQE99_14385 [Maritimibacter sp. DP07]|uniref:Uncharacterized protein n=1 Tax=Maritimibacter harenae TaxID=2606218 RepID=A0A845M8I9_9RHOB|nr:hypothetical protein [Maritimibacter harenae]MZR14207.1 hypothetical protein [Maritimibacter harenae]